MRREVEATASIIIEFFERDGGIVGTNDIKYFLIISAEAVENVKYHFNI